MLTCNNKELSDFVLYLSDKASAESAIFPVDREFLQLFLNKIQLFNSVEFVFCNLEMLDSLYVNKLFVCLPEVWQMISVDDIAEMLDSFTNKFSYFSLIKFTYKYLEIDILNLVFDSQPVKRSRQYQEEIVLYLKRQWNVLIKSESDLEDFEDGFIDVDINEWIYLKQRLLLDHRILPAVLDLSDMEKYITKRFGRVQKDDD